MKPNRLIGLSIMLAGLLLFITCRKMDYSPPKEETVSLSPVLNKFFNSHRTNDETENAIVDFLIRRNQKDNFVEKTVKLIGFPRWDKTIFLKNSKISHSRTENNPDSNSIFYIPFVRDSQNYVNASLIIKVQHGDTSLSYACDWQYQNKVFGSPQIDTSAERHAILFMLLDNRTFGYTKFNITDENLFSPSVPVQNQQRQLTFINTYEPPSAGRGSLAELLVYNEICVDYYVCGTPDADECYNGCDYLNCPTGQCYLQQEICEGWWEETGGGGGGTGGTGGTGGSGGSGGGSGGSTPPECPGTPVARTEDVTNPCTPGWNPNTGGGNNTSHNPCDTLNKYSQGNDFLLMLQALKNEVPTRKENLYTFHNTLIPSSNSNPISLTNGNENEFSVYPPNENVFQGCWGWFHNHFADADSASLIFSAGDLNMLAEQIIRDSAFFHVDYKKFMIGVVADSNAQYILMVEDINQFTAWATTYNNEYLISVLLNAQSLNQAALPLSVAETEKRFLKSIKNSGLKLFRGSNDFTT